MTTADHPANQQPHGLGNLVQINRKATAFNPKPWVVVENAGTDNENLVIDFATFREACNWIDRNYTDDDCPADIMRRNDDGTLTTEY